MIRLHYTTAGDPQNPPMVLIHGLFGNGNNMMKLAKILEDSYHVILPDQRNHGKSPWHDLMNYPAMADDIAAMLNSIHVDKVIIAGHSMGGKTAMKFASRYPHRVSSLVVLDIAPVQYPHQVNLALTRAMQNLELKEIQSLHQAQQQLAVSDKVIKLFLLQNLVRDKGKFRWRLNLEAIKNAMTTISGFPSHSKNTRKPALFLYGTASDYVLPEHHKLISQVFHNSTMVPVAGADHWLHTGHSEQVAAAIMEFIGRQN